VPVERNPGICGAAPGAVFDQSLEEARASEGEKLRSRAAQPETSRESMGFALRPFARSRPKEPQEAAQGLD